MLLQLVERLACPALHGYCPAGLEPGLGEALTGSVELLFDQADSAVALLLGPGRGRGGLVSLGHRLLGRCDVPAVALAVRPLPGLRQHRDNCLHG